MQKEKEAFESTLKQIGRVDDSNFTVADDGSYEWDFIHFAWTIWQAAKAQAEKALLEQFEINNKLVEQIEKLKAQAVPEWNDVNLLSPQIDTEVLICIDDDVKVAIYRHDLNGDGYFEDVYSAKWWMPLPKPQEQDYESK